MVCRTLILLPHCMPLNSLSVSTIASSSIWSQRNVAVFGELSAEKEQWACFLVCSLHPFDFMKHQWRFQIPWRNKDMPGLHLLKLWLFHHQKLFDVQHPSTNNISWSFCLWWFWSDHILPLVRWVWKEIYCMLPKDHSIIGQCKGIYRDLWLLMVVLVCKMHVLLCCGFMPSLERMYPRYSISLAQNVDLGTLTFKSASCNIVKTIHRCSRWLSRLVLVIQSKPPR